MAENTIDVTDDNFQQEVLEADVPVLVDFWAEWCMPCKMIAPIVEELSEEYGDKLKVVKVDCDSCRNTAVNYGISAIPTVMLFKDGQAVKKFVGVKQKPEFKSAIDEAIG